MKRKKQAGSSWGGTCNRLKNQKGPRSNLQQMVKWYIIYIYIYVWAERRGDVLYQNCGVCSLPRKTSSNFLLTGKFLSECKSLVTHVLCSYEVKTHVKDKKILPQLKVQISEPPFYELQIWKLLLVLLTGRQEYRKQWVNFSRLSPVSERPHVIYPTRQVSGCKIVSRGPGNKIIFHDFTCI